MEWRALVINVLLEARPSALNKHEPEDTPREYHVARLAYSACSEGLVVFKYSQIRKIAYVSRASGGFPRVLLRRPPVPPASKVSPPENLRPVSRTPPPGRPVAGDMHAPAADKERRVDYITAIRNQSSRSRAPHRADDGRVCAAQAHATVHGRPWVPLTTPRLKKNSSFGSNPGLLWMSTCDAKSGASFESVHHS